jgi:hypothetical protein
MSHYVAYINHPYRRVELDADDCLSARHRAAMLLDTRRVGIQTKQHAYRHMWIMAYQRRVDA